MEYFLSEPCTPLPYNFVLLEKRDGSTEKHYINGQILNPPIKECIDRVVRDELARRPDALCATLYNVEYNVESDSKESRFVRRIMAEGVV